MKRHNPKGWFLLVLGVMLLFFAAGPRYQYLINPKYRLLTIFGGVVLASAALSVIGRYRSRIRKGQAIAYSLFILVFVIAYATAGPQQNIRSKDLYAVNAQPAGPPDRKPDPDQSRGSELPRMELNGTRYTGINTIELLNLVDRGDPLVKNGRFVLRGMVKRTDELDRMGQFTVVRIGVFCCLADAVSIGFRVEGEDPQQYNDGQWVRVYGMLSENPSGEPPASDIYVKDMFFTVVEENYTIIAEKVEEIEDPPSPFAFDFSETEPFSY
jgi:uncharacterized repeat protein (TIGR03943 family)